MNPYHDDELRAMIAAGTMDYNLWRSLGYGQRERVRDMSGLEPRLKGYEGFRVECLHNGERVRFNVGLSTGWKPCHLRVHNARCMGGDPIKPGSVSEVRVIRKVR
jgi:hypothetical protein